MYQAIKGNNNSEFPGRDQSTGFTRDMGFSHLTAAMGAVQYSDRI